MSERPIQGRSYLSSVLVLSAGTALSQALPILASPILSRLYKPEDFGLLAVFMALVSSVGMAISGRYDLAMLLPKKVGSARQLLGLACLAAAVLSAAYLLLLSIEGDIIRQTFEAGKLNGWIYLVPLALLLTGLRTTLGYWTNRQGDFRLLARVQLWQAAAVTLLSLLFGVVGKEFPGLLTANLIGLLCGVVLLAYVYHRDLRLRTLKWSRAKLVLAWRFRKFPLFSASSAVLDGFKLSVPVLFMAHYFPDNVVGLYAMVLRVASAPLSFVSSAVAQVHLKTLVDLLHAQGDVRSYLIRLTVVLSGIAIVPMVIIMPIAPWLFATVFGAQWREAGVYLQILMPSLAVRFVASTMSFTTEATNNSQLGAIWKATALIVTCAVLAVMAPRANIHRLFVALNICDIGLYVWYYYVQFCAAMKPRTG